MTTHYVLPSLSLGEPPEPGEPSWATGLALQLRKLRRTEATQGAPSHGPPSPDSSHTTPSKPVCTPCTCTHMHTCKHTHTGPALGQFLPKHCPVLCGWGKSSLPVLIYPVGCYYTFQTQARQGGRRAAGGERGPESSRVSSPGRCRGSLSVSFPVCACASLTHGGSPPPGVPS